MSKKGYAQFTPGEELQGTTLLYMYHWTGVECIRGNEMKVYIAEAHTDYEGFMIAGVFVSRENAVSCLRDARYKSYDELIIEVFDVNKSYDYSKSSEEEIIVRKGKTWMAL